MSSSASSRTPNIKPILSLSRTDVSIKWSTDNIERLLQLISTNDKYRLAFFPQGSIKQKVCDVARELCIELQEDDPKYMEMLERRGQVVRKGRRWVPTATWTSSYNNPVVTKYHDLKKRYADATVAFTIRPGWTSFKHVPGSFREDIQKSCPWYFMFKKLDTGSPASSSDTDNAPLRSKIGTANENTHPRLSDGTVVQPAAPVPNPFLGLRPMARRPNFEALPSSSRPTLPRGQAGTSRQAPIEIDSESDLSSVLEEEVRTIRQVTKATSTKPKKSSKESESMKFRTASGRPTTTDEADLKRLKRHFRIAIMSQRTEQLNPRSSITFPANVIGTIRLDLTKWTSRMRSYGEQKPISCSGFCETWKALYIDPTIQKNRSARADQIRRTIESAGGKMYTSKKEFTSDMKRTLRIYLFDDSEEAEDMDRPVGFGNAEQDLQHRVYDILDLGEFLRRRFYHDKT